MQCITFHLFKSILSMNPDELSQKECSVKNKFLVTVYKEIKVLKN